MIDNTTYISVKNDLSSLLRYLYADLNMDEDQIVRFIQAILEGVVRDTQKGLPKTVLKTCRYIRQDATLSQLYVIERELKRVIRNRRRQLQKVDLYV